MISEHISYLEATKSETAIRNGIKNVPTTNVETTMKNTAEKVFEPVRNHFGLPIAVTSFFRCKALNELISGSKTSQHMKGEAIDMDADVLFDFNLNTHGKTIYNKDIFEFIRDNLEFDQLIWEYGDDRNPAWVHVSYSEKYNRGEVWRRYPGQQKPWVKLTVIKF